jgi:leader peptidase (prepilin peptidase)/N-methyltransferase
MIIILTLFFFVFGLIIGSFLNVVILRLNTSRSLGGRSACMSCRTTLRWYELIPLFSYLFLLGRCRTCKTKIAIQYPLVEFITGIIFVGLFWKFQDLFFANTTMFVFVYFYYLVIFALLVVIVFYDLRHKIIPDNLALTLGILAFLGLFCFNLDGALGLPFVYLHLPSLTQFLSGFFIAAPFAFFWLVSSGRWMGLGDAKLAISCGWLLGFAQALSGVVIAFWIGAAVGILLVIFSKKYKIRSEVPFAPFLALGIFLVFIFGLNFFGLPIF